MYHIEVDNFNNYTVSILEKKDFYNSKLHWIIEPNPDGEPIVLAEFFTKTKFLIVDSKGRLQAFDISTKQKIYEKNYNNYYTCGAVLNPEKTHLILAINPDRAQSYVRVLDLNHVQEVLNFNLDTPFDRVSTDQLAFINNRICFYHHSKVDGEYKHGMLTIGIENGTPEIYKIDYPHWEKFDRDNCSPKYNFKDNTGIIPYWGPIEIKTNNNGDKTFSYKILIFNLNDFSTEKIISIHDIPLQHLNYHEDESTKIGYYLGSEDQNSKEYKDAYRKFMSNLNGIFVDEINGGYWVTLRTGILKKVSTTDASPIYIINQIDDEEIKPYELNGFYEKVIESENNKLRLKYHDDYEVNIPIATSEKIIQVKASTFIRNIESSDEINKTKELINKVVVEIEDCKSESSLLNGLDQMIELTKNIDRIRSGSILNFHFIDSNNGFLDEKSFFEAVTPLKKAPRKIIKIINNFVKYSGTINTLYLDEETTSLAYAALELLKLDKKYIDNIIDYLSVIDYEHDVFNGDELIPLLAEKYHESQGKKILKKLNKLPDGWGWVEIYESCLEEV